MGIFDIFTKKGYSKWHQKQIDTFKKNITQAKNTFEVQKQLINDYGQALKQLKDALSSCFKKNHVSDKLNIPTYLRQIEESIEIIGNSKNPDTVISRFDFLQGIYLKLSNASDSVPNLNELSTHLQQVISEKNKYINASIKRALDDELIKIDQLKTEKGKINRLHRFFEKMRTIPDLPSENMEYIDKLEQETQI